MALTEYEVTLTADDPDVLRRIALLNSALFRICEVAQLRKVLSTDYRKGEFKLRVLAERASPELVPGEVHVRVDPVEDDEEVVA